MGDGARMGAQISRFSARPERKQIGGYLKSSLSTPHLTRTSAA